MYGSHSRRELFSIAICSVIAIAVGDVRPVCGQELPSIATDAQIQAHLNAGEFPCVKSAIAALPIDSANLWRQRLAIAQNKAGSRDAACQTVASIGDDRQRATALAQIIRYPVGGYHNPVASGLGGPANSGQPNSSNGQAGGVTMQDFFPLINLITNTVSTDSWQQTGGQGTIQAYPSGVFVDSFGALKKIKVDSSRTSLLNHANVLSDRGNRQPQWPAEMRKVSLTRLEKEAQLRVARGLRIDDVMLNLAGITEIKYVMAFPDKGEVIIAGPAGPWKYDELGRSVNIENGNPVLQLDDFVVCLRNAILEGGQFGCSISPRQKNLADTQHFLASSNLKGKRWSEQLRETLGQQDIEVFGLDNRTHAARILVEADYRMKLIGIGLEPSVPEVPSYFDRVQLNVDGSLPPMDIVRWWFTLNYDDVICNSERSVFTFTGSGVKVLSENELLGDEGKRIHTGQSGGPTKSFARDFTTHFSKIADEYPIYRELKNVFDLAVVAGLIGEQNLAQHSNWHFTFFGPPVDDQPVYRVRMDAVPQVVDSVMNERTIKIRKRNSTLNHTLIGVSGGIRCEVQDVIAHDRIKVAETLELDRTRQAARPGDDQSHWWWD